MPHRARTAHRGPVGLGAEDLELLSRRCPLFAGLSGDEIGRLLEGAGARISRHPAQSPIRLYGSELHDVGIVLQGRVEVQQDDAFGRSFMMASLVAGQIFGEVVTYATPPRWLATVIASGHVRCLFIPLLSFQAMIEGRCELDAPQCARLAANAVRLFAAKALNLHRRVGILTLRGMRERIAALLLEARREHGSDSFRLPLDREAMARYLHVSRPSLSRELARMRDEGLISFERSRFTILDLERLSAPV